jgi:hypothetical protein
MRCRCDCRGLFRFARKDGVAAMNALSQYVGCVVTVQDLAAD